MPGVSMRDVRGGKRLAGLTPDRRAAGLTPERHAAGLTPEAA